MSNLGSTMNSLKILYVGPDYPGSNGTCWRDAFLELGHEVRTLNTDELVPAPTTLAGMVRQKLLGRPIYNHVSRLNWAVVREVQMFRPHLTFYIQARYILPETLGETARCCLNFAYMNDDMFNPRNQSFTFLEAIKRIDCILTTKSYNVSEFHAARAPLAIYTPNAYDPKIHYPAKPSAEERTYYKGDVAFIGTFRSERADFLARVAELGGQFTFNVWGGGWDKMRRPIYWHKWSRWRTLKPCVRRKELRCADMGKAIQSNKICLGLLYRANRDLHTSRSFEIPACGGFMLAERTDEHRMYFEEDREAAYFSSFEEMLDKFRYYLAHEEERQRIAWAGYQRCVCSSYRYVDRAVFAIEQFQHLRGTAVSRVP